MKSVIFDMDGTMVDTEMLHYDSAREIIAQYGKDYTLGLHDRYTGTTEDHFWKNIIIDLDIDEGYEILKDKKEKLYLKKISDGIKAFEGVIPLIKKLNRKTKLAIASSSRRKLIDLTIRKLSLEGYFDVIVSSDDIMRSKPDPEIYLKAALKIGSGPKDCVVIEDSINGVKAAKSAGMRCVAVTNSFSRKMLGEADYIIGSIKHFDLKWLE